jgi:hypothetical protein
MRLCLAALCLLVANAAADPLVWFVPLDFFERPEVGYSGSPEYMSLFDPGAPWPVAASHVGVFKIYPQWISRASDDDLQRMFADLNRRHIALALEYGVLSASATCGIGVEGFGGGTLVSAARRIARNGGRLRYLAMDEPIFFSTLYTGANACQWTVDHMAANAAANLRALLQEFPDVLIGDIEPMPVSAAGWLDQYRHGVDALESELGFPLAFFHSDVLWSTASWKSDLAAMRQSVEDRGIPFGVIYNGDPSDLSDAAWINTAIAHMTQYEFTSPPPDHVIFQSWHAYPKKLLPETDPDSFTSLINRYFRTRTNLSLQTSDSGLSGTLTAAGDALPGAAIDVTAQPLTGDGVETVYRLTGTAPAGATTIVMGLRVNLECACAGPSQFRVSRFRYALADGVTNERDFSRGLQGWGLSNPQVAAVVDNALDVSAGASQSLILNSAPIGIQPPGDYEFAVTARVAPLSAGSGYFVLVFLADKELARVRIPFAAATLPLATAITGDDGTWLVDAAKPGPGDWRFTAAYAGDDQYWPAQAVIPSR